MVAWVGGGQLTDYTADQAGTVYGCYREQYSQAARPYRGLQSNWSELPGCYGAIHGVPPEPIDYPTFLLYGITGLEFELQHDDHPSRWDSQCQVRAKPLAESTITKLVVARAVNCGKLQVKPEIVAHLPTHSADKLKQLREVEELGHCLLIKAAPDGLMSRPPCFGLGVYDLQNLDPATPPVRHLLKTAVDYLAIERQNRDGIEQLQADSDRVCRQFGELDDEFRPKPSPTIVKKLAGHVLDRES